MVPMNILANLNIVITDDEPLMLEVLTNSIRHEGGSCSQARNITETLTLIENNQYDVALIDICLNGDGSGIELLDKIKKIDPMLSIILITGHDVEKYMTVIIQKEVYALTKKPYDVPALNLLLLQGAKNTKNARKNFYTSSNLKNKIERIKTEKDRMFVQTLLSLTNALEQKDEYTKNHSVIVSKIGRKIAMEISEDANFIEDIEIAGELHDIGKIGIKDAILFKKDTLTDYEYDLIKKHPEMSYKIIKPIDTRENICTIVLHHHERWDGTGYPHKLAEKNIPLGSRILSVADSYNALTSNRPYRDAQTMEYATQQLFDGINTQYDKEIVEIFYSLMKKKIIQP